MIKIRKNTDIQELTKMVGAENIAFTYSIERKEWFSCTCGYASPKNDKAFYDENGKYVRKCPECGTSWIIEDIEQDNEVVPILFQHKKVLENDRFFLLKFQVYALDFSDDFSSPTMIKGYPDDILAYDKKEKMLFFIEDDYWFGAWWEIEGPISYCMYEEETCICVDGSYYPIKTANQNDSSIYWYCVHDDLFELSGLKSIAMDICAMANRMDLMDNIPEYCSLYELLDYLILYINCPWVMDMEEKLRKLKIPIASSVSDFVLKPTDGYKGFWNTYFELKEFGLSPNADTVEQVWLMNINQLACIGSISGYKKLLSMMDSFEDAVRIIQMMSQNTTIPTDKWEGMLRLIKDSGIPAEQVIRYVRNGVLDGYKADVIIAECFKNKDDKGNIMVDFNGKFSSESIRRREIVESGIMSGEQYDMIAENPTAENVIAALKI